MVERSRRRPLLTRSPIPPHIATPLEQQVPFLSIRGNHDYRTAPQAEIEYFEKHGEAGRWYMPSPGYYAVQKRLADGTTVDLVFVDTITLAPRAAEKQVQLPPDVAAAKREQYAWLEATLRASAARGSDWRIVVGHHPIFSSGEHGDTPELVEELLPLLDRYGVDMYLSGHDHTMQHLQHRGSGVQFLVNGSGSKLGTLEMEHATRATTSKAAQVYFGYMAHEITKDRMTTRALDSAGRTQYVFSQAPRSKAPPALATPSATTTAIKAAASAPAFHHHAAPSKQAVHQRGAISTAEGEAAFDGFAPASTSSSSTSSSGSRRTGGLRLMRRPLSAADASPLVVAVAGGLLALMALMALAWRRQSRQSSRPRRYHSVVRSSAAAAAAASVGRGVWSDDELCDSDLDLEGGGSEGGEEEFQVELPHLT
jgi:hypothetical protein